MIHVSDKNPYELVLYVINADGERVKAGTAVVSSTDDTATIEVVAEPGFAASAASLTVFPD